jgi:hypothetical protein
VFNDKNQDQNQVERIVEWLSEREDFASVCKPLSEVKLKMTQSDSQDPYDSIYMTMMQGDGVLDIPEELS